MKINEIRKLSDADLAKKIIETKEELFTKRLQHSTGNLEKPAQLRALRREIAKLKTVQKERELEGGRK